MNGITKAFVLVSFLIGGLGDAAFAQTKEVTRADIAKLEMTAMTLIRSMPHRTIWTSWVYPERGKEASYKSVLTREIDSSGRTRSVQEQDAPGSFKRMEIISIDGKNYRKIDGNPWNLLPPPPDYVGSVNSPPSPGSKPRFETSAKLVETLNGNDGMVSVYETVSKMTREVDGKEISQITTNRYWFRYDGRLLRKDGELENVGEPRILKNSMVYEYDNNIKIVEPLIN